MRLLVGLLGSSLLVLGIGAAVIHFATRALLLREFDSTLRAKAMALAAATDLKKSGVEFDLADELLQEFSRPRSAEYFQLWDSNGRTLARSPSLGTNDLARPFDSVSSPQFWNLQLPNGRWERAVEFQFTADDSGIDEQPASVTAPHPTLTLVVASNLRSVRRTLEALTNALLLAAAIVLVGMMVIVRLIVRRGLTPLADVADRAAHIDAASLGQRFATESLPTELLPIGHRLNDLLARLEKSFERERQFTADAAHELRTPIAELRSLAEVALKWPDATATADAFRDALAIAQRMEALVAGLLTLARYETGKQPIGNEPVSLAALVTEIWTPLMESIRDKQITARIEIPSNLTVNTDGTLLRLIVTNLLTNAAEYTPRNGVVRIHAVQRDGTFTFNVTNTVTGLSTDDLPHLFERFWRKDVSRTGSEHSGLGLALAKACADTLGMSLTTTMPDSDTVTVSLT